MQPSQINILGPIYHNIFNTFFLKLFLKMLPLNDTLYFDEKSVILFLSHVNKLFSVDILLYDIFYVFYLQIQNTFALSVASFHGFIKRPDTVLDI